MNIKYMGIVLCFFYVIVLLPKDTEKQDTYIVQTALFFTLLADTFLVKIGDMLLGISSFIMVQICYFYRLHKGHVRTVIWNGVVFLILYYGMELSLKEIPLEAILASFYFVTLVRNVWDVFRRSKNRFFQMGMVLFLLCDLSVGLYNLPKFLIMPPAYMVYLYPVVAKIMWVFYLPSQVLLCSSIKKQE